LYLSSNLTLINEFEWNILRHHYDVDIKIQVEKFEIGSDDKMDDICQTDTVLTFTPDLCQICIENNKRREFVFTKKKVFIKFVKDDVDKDITDITKDDCMLDGSFIDDSKDQMVN
jgi:hypothetical protein